MKTQEAIVLFQNYQRKRQSPESVVYDYSRSIEKILTQLQRRDSWQSISSSEIEDLVLSWTCKVSTKQKYLAQMRSFLNFCYHKGYHTLS
nr:MAG TPA: integrase [Caudoviricetes sp.]DAP10992.1 MAG TPA: integrase [Caudoviricetes sp.]